MTETAIRQASDIDWIEEEAWRRAEAWTATPQLVFALKALIEQERLDTIAKAMTISINQELRDQHGSTYL